MASDEIIVSIGAKIDELIAGFNKAAEQVGDSLGQIETRIATAAQTLEGKLAPAAEHASRSLNTIGETSQGIGGALDELRGKFNTALEVTGIAVALEIVERLKDALDETAQRAVEFQHLGESVGIGSTAMQGLTAAADAAGISSSRLERTMFLIQQRMQQAAEQGGEAADKFNKLGISNSELGDSSFTVLDAMERLGATTNSTAQLVGLLGARGAEVIPMLRALAENHGLVAGAAGQVNALLPSEIAVMQEYHATIATASTQLENFATRLLASAVPAIKELVQEFQELTTTGPVMQEIVSAVGSGLQTLVVTATELAYAFKGAIDVILNGLQLVISPIAATGAALAAVAHGNFAEAKDIMVAGFEDIGSNWKGLMATFDADVKQGEQAVARMRDAVAGLDEVHPNLQRMEMPTHTAVPDKEGQKAAEEAARAQMDATLAGIQQQMDLTKDQAKNFQITAEQELAIEKDLIGQKLTAETAYYEKLKTLANGKVSEIAKANAGEQKATDDANTAMLAATLRAADTLRKAQVAAASETAAETLDATLAGIKQQESALEDLAKTHQIMWSQELAGERQLIGQSLAARLDYYEKLKQLATGNAQEIAKIERQEVQAAAQAATQMQQAQQKASDAMRSQWQSVTNQISSALANNITKMLSGTESFTQGMRSMFASMASSIIQTLIKVAVQMELNSIIAKATGQDAAKSNILAYAAQAASAAMASAASIPGIGWILAPIAGAAVYAAALAFPSAEGGFDIPAGMNPVTQLHEREMVLPAHLAEGIRGMISGDNGGGGRSAGAVHFHVSAMDGADVAAFFHKHGDKIADSINTQRHRFHPSFAR